ncbi:putative oocyte-secreted protein 1 homolog isoform X1 [Prionailurus iriomotensis]
MYVRCSPSLFLARVKSTAFHNDLPVAPDEVFLGDRCPVTSVHPGFYEFRYHPKDCNIRIEVLPGKHILFVSEIIFRSKFSDLEASIPVACIVFHRPGPRGITTGNDANKQGGLKKRSGIANLYIGETVNRKGKGHYCLPLVPIQEVVGFGLLKNDGNTVMVCDLLASTLTSGQLALAILALGACKTPDETSIPYPNLVKNLRNKFKAEIKNMGKHNGNPLTNYYQLSLDVLALCLFRGKFSITQVAKIFEPENKNFYFKGQFSVGESLNPIPLAYRTPYTGAMAVLALTCVKNITNGKKKTDMENLNNINNHIKSLIEKILSQKKENGLLGNIYSTGEAMQDYYNESKWDCQRTLDTVIMEIHKGTFRIPTAAAQILPALMGKTYLNVNKDSPCVYGPGDFNISTVEPITVTPPLSPSQIQVNYSVVIIKETHSTTVSVANGSVFLDVMEAAQKENATLFGFTVEERSWGPYITSVQGLTANNNNRTFWELLNNGQPLDQGVGSYIVHEGDNLEVRWSTY